ncbi:MAG: hypothetical protein NVS9B1_13700 [Candidatus Dormibacteraceae bacterium]
MNDRTLARTLAALLGVLVLAACGGSGATTGASAPNVDKPGFTGTGKAALSTTGVRSAGPPAIQPAGVSDVVPPIGEGPRVIRTARMTVEVGNGLFDSTLDRLLKLTSDLGGYVSGSDAAVPTGSLRTGTITFQVPADRFNDAIAAIRGLGKLQGMAIGGQDVSLQYVDLQARLRNAEAQRDAMLALLQQAKTVQEILAVQNQLGQVTGQIEQLKGQIAYFDHATGFSTISVSMHEASVVVKPPVADPWGFRSAWSDALRGFANTLDFVLVGLGTAAPVLLLVLMGLVAWRLRRRFAL